MLYPDKSFFRKLLEATAMFALAAWLVKTGICMIESVWGWIILLCVIAGIAVVGIRLYKHYKDQQF